MAVQDRESTADLKESLLKEGRTFSFFQALRLLRLLRPPAREGDPGVSVRPDLSLAFPASDVSSIEEMPDGNYRVTTPILGLYGVASPLPTFYTEDLFSERREDASVQRDFLDVFHLRIFQLLYDAWKKYHAFARIVEDGDDAMLTLLYALSGLSTEESSEDEHGEAFPLLRYTGLFGRRPRSALALETLLKDFLQGVGVEVISCVPRQVPIPEDQRLRLGEDEQGLGIGTIVGMEIADRQSKFRVRFGPLNAARFRALLLQGNQHAIVTRLIERFLTDPLCFDFELVLAAGEVRPVQLGMPQWTRLGLDTLVHSGEYPYPLHVLCPATNAALG